MAQTYESTSRRNAPQAAPSGWAVGWTAFAGIIMAIQGFWWVFAGIVALFSGDFYVTTPNYIFQFDVTAWGWMHIIFGAIVATAGFGVFAAKTWARVVGVVVAGFAMLAAFAWLPWYPIWGVMFIVASTCVIWALTAHGDDIAHG